MRRMKQEVETIELNLKVTRKKLKATRKILPSIKNLNHNPTNGDVIMSNGTGNRKRKTESESDEVENKKGKAKPKPDEVENKKGKAKPKPDEVENKKGKAKPKSDEVENKKRKAELEPDKPETKKSRSNEEIPNEQAEEAKASADIENNVVSSDDNTAKGRNLKTKSKKQKSAHVQKPLSGTASKRLKDLLEVPKLPTISGVLFVMGINDVGQIGMGVDVTGRKRPTELLNSLQFVGIAAGAMHSVCLTSKGEVYTFGCNDEGALGRHTEEQEDECEPARVNIPGVVVKVSAGDSHSAALTENGQVFIWGNFRNSTGMLGLLTEGVKCSTPQRIMHDTIVVDIASGSDHFVCLSNDGQVFTCGNAEFGQLGRITERSCKGDSRKGFGEHLQMKFITWKSNLRPVKKIWVGHCNTYIKTKDDAIYACGLNNFNQLGLPVMKDSNGEPEKFMYFQPTLVRSFGDKLDWQHINAGQHHALALDGNGRVYALGRKEYGRLGLGENCEDAESPSLIPVLENKKSIDISCGNVVSFAVTDDGIVHSWGFGENHQLGHGSTDDVYEPTPIAGKFQESWYAIKVSGGGQHTLIIANRKGTTNETKE